MLVTSYKFRVEIVWQHQQQFGVYLPFPGKCRASSFTSSSTRRDTAGDYYYKLMKPYLIAKRNVPNYPKAFPCVNQLLPGPRGLSLLTGETCRQPPQRAFYSVSISFNQILVYTWQCPWSPSILETLCYKFHYDWKIIETVREKSKVFF